MRTLHTILIIILLIFVFLAGFFLDRFVFTGRVVEVIDVNNKYTYTKAICKENKCVDVLITCEDGKVVGMEPVSDFVEHPEEWIDLRNLSESFCG